MLCDAGLCTGCGACSQVCPKGCVSLVENSEGFRQPVIQRESCAYCNLCARVCPVNHPPEKRGGGACYFGWHKSPDTVLRSSSGGAFTALAEQALRLQGVVFGAFHDVRNNALYHKAVHSADELDDIRKSKYFQSDTRNTFIEAREFLGQGKWVLYSGTPCQIAGVVNFLRDVNTAKLVTAEVICHGVTSGKVVDAFVRTMAVRVGAIHHIEFRVKSVPWLGGGGTSVNLIFQDGRSAVLPKREDGFFMAFNHNVILREACYSCTYAQPERVADFTLGDFWGIPEALVPAHRLETGVSAVIVNSEKAGAFLEALAPTFECHPVDRALVAARNRTLSSPPKRHKRRDYFFTQLGEDNFMEVLERCFPLYHARLSAKRALGPAIWGRLKRLKATLGH